MRRMGLLDTISRLIGESAQVRCQPSPASEIDAIAEHEVWKAVGFSSDTETGYIARMLMYMQMSHLRVFRNQENHR